MLARVHALLGLIPLGGYLVYHLIENWAAFDGREAWVERSGEHGARPLIVLIVLLPLALHAGLGIVRLVRQPAHPLTGARGLRVLQAVTGGLALAFIVFHVAEVWTVYVGPHSDARAFYAVVYRSAGQPLRLALYLIGLTALSFHMGHGFSRAAVTLGLSRSATAQFWFRAAGFALGFGLWALFLQLLGRFALGYGVIW